MSVLEGTGDRLATADIREERPTNDEGKEEEE
jgi:hypothetical protein